MADDGDRILQGMTPLSLENLVRSEGEGAVIGPDALSEMTPNGILLAEEGVISRPFNRKKKSTTTNLTKARKKKKPCKVIKKKP